MPILDYSTRSALEKALKAFTEKCNLEAELLKIKIEKEKSTD